MKAPAGTGLATDRNARPWWLAGAKWTCFEHHLLIVVGADLAGHLTVVKRVTLEAVVVGLGGVGYSQITGVPREKRARRFRIPAVRS
jgi:hypothetical protein